MGKCVQHLQNSILCGCSGCFKGFFTGIDDHSGIKSIINVPSNDTTAVPVDNGCQVKKSVLHWNVCNVNRPCLIGTVYDCVTKQIWTNFCLLHALRQIHLWINRCNVHFTHISACFTATNLISAQFKLSRHLTGSPSRVIRMQMVNDSFAFQFFLRNREPTVIHTGTVDFKQLCTGRNW